MENIFIMSEIKQEENNQQLLYYLRDKAGQQSTLIVTMLEDIETLKQEIHKLKTEVNQLMQTQFAFEEADSNKF